MPKNDCFLKKKKDTQLVEVYFCASAATLNQVSATMSALLRFRSRGYLIF